MENSVKKLFINFINNRCDPEDAKRVKELTKSGKYEPEWREAMEYAEHHFTETKGIRINKQEIFRKINKEIHIKKFLISARTVRSLAAAAALLIFVSITSIFFYYRKEKSTAPKIARTAINLPEKSINHSWIKLSDGSSVQLNNGSHLYYPKSFEGKAIREVALTGEAYFDIKHDALHPFIIHTGKIKTTVLGTAFNISAYQANNSVIVTVTRGKVLVQDEQKTLGVLTPNQQLVWNATLVKKNNISTTNTEKLIAWKNLDLIMDDITMEEAANLISKRYGVKIEFKNNKVRNCRFTAAFLNRNKIEQVLTVLETITGSTLTLENGTVTIDGTGC